MTGENETTISYVRIVEHREKAIRIDLGEGEPVWFPRAKIRLDETNYSLTAPQALIDEKRRPDSSSRAALPFMRYAVTWPHGKEDNIEKGVQESGPRETSRLP